MNNVPSRILAAAMFCGALLLAACGEDPAPPETAAAAAPVAADGPAAATAATAPAARAPLVDTCNLVPTDALADVLGGIPVSADVTFERDRYSTLAGACRLAVPGQPGLRVELFTEESWKRADLSLAQHWNRQIAGKGARRADGLQAPAYWVVRPKPQRRALLVHGQRGIYEFSSANAHGTPMRATLLERAAAATLAQE